MKTQFSITVKNKKYPYTLEKKSKGIIRVVVPSASINQDFLEEDIAQLIFDLPELIVAEEKYKEKQSNVIRFRVTDEEKRNIEKKAMREGFTSVSAYLRKITA